MFNNIEKFLPKDKNEIESIVLDLLIDIKVTPMQQKKAVSSIMRRLDKI